MPRAAAVGHVANELVGAGFDAIRVEVLTAADAEGSSASLDRVGLAGVKGCFLLSLRDDLDLLESARQKLPAGHVILAVPVADEDGKPRARDILRATPATRSAPLDA